MSCCACPECNKIFKGEFPCPGCGWEGPYREPQTVFNLDPLDGGREYASEIRHPKIDFEGH
jgi:hypothetical protein